ncbi:MAG TPA: redox-regulated ATPase YchF [Candidatus Gracilibacteria bacterium]
MNLKIGIVGLPNVGKSTLFNALTKSQKADAQNFPFCTIDPNIGIVEVPDQRVDKLAEIVKPNKVVRSAVEFVDIAGLVAGASEGEGLGNKFLSHIRECDAIAHVIRAFESTDIHHVSGSIDPARDLDIIMTELILADLESVNRQLERVAKKAKSGDKESQIALGLLEKIKSTLEDGKLSSTVEIENKEKEGPLMKSFQLLTRKPYLVVANVAENQFAGFDTEALRKKLISASSQQLENVSIVPICARIEEELGQLEREEAQMFLEELGASRSGLESLTQESFRLLGLQSYFTAGVQEVRAWTIYRGDTAPRAAGAIHTDFEKGFIKADVIAYQDFIDNGGEQGAKEAGKMRLEGKEYIVADGDVMHFKFSS